MKTVFESGYFKVAALSFLISLSVTVETPLADTTPAPSEFIVVAVIDTGLDPNHPMIKPFLWTNPGESGLDSEGRDRSSNGIDDDRNGYIDDIHGWDFINQSADIRDSHGHGTHIAGLITKHLATNSKVKVMALKYYQSDATEHQTLTASNLAIRYALEKGVKIINYSGGGDLPSPEERDLFAQADQQGIFTVAASGNDGRSNDGRGFYPASYDLSKMISVGSTTQEGELLPSSNRGPNSVDVAAPGLEILSALPAKRFGKLTGTSQATAQVTGVLAALMENSPQLNGEELKIRLIQTGSQAKALEGQVRFPRIPDHERAVHMRDSNEFNAAVKTTSSRVKEIFDEPLTWSKEVSAAGGGAEPLH